MQADIPTMSVVHQLIVTAGQDDSEAPTQKDEETDANIRRFVPPNTDILSGWLHPGNNKLDRIDLLRSNSVYTVGRAARQCNIFFNGPKISKKHCEIKWDGTSTVVTDFSTNGTFINGKRMSVNETRVLRDGNEISFGQLPNGNLDDDFHFIYRAVTKGLAKGLYAHYDILHELGRGCFGAVYKALRRQSGDFWAVKMLHNTRASFMTGMPIVPTFNVEREMSILGELKHPNVVALRDTFMEDNGSIMLVTELVDGGDLLDYITSGGVPGEDMARHLLLQICDALIYCHDSGIAHRDMKPDNILVTKTVPVMVKVGDFGLARVVDPNTLMKTMCGTPTYLAPEIVLGDGGYTHLVDVWSLGVMAFAMITCTLPFKDDSSISIQERMKNRRPHWEDLANFSENCRDWISSIMQPDPNLRMTLRHAEKHPWMKAFRRFYVIDSVSNKLVRAYDGPVPLSLDPFREAPENRVDTAMDALRNLNIRGTHSNIDGSLPLLRQHPSDDLNVVVPYEVKQYVDGLDSYNLVTDEMDALDKGKRKQLHDDAENIRAPVENVELVSPRKKGRVEAEASPSKKRRSKKATGAPPVRASTRVRR